jgi:hypothetical protein
VPVVSRKLAPVSWELGTRSTAAIFHEARISLRAHGFRVRPLPDDQVELWGRGSKFLGSMSWGTVLEHIRQALAHAALAGYVAEELRAAVDAEEEPQEPPAPPQTPQRTDLRLTRRGGRPDLTSFRAARRSRRRD